MATMVMCSLVHIAILFSFLPTATPRNNVPEDVDDDPYVETTFPTELCESRLPTCQCLDYEDLVGLVCSNVTDFDHFSRTLYDGSVFEENSTYEITFTGERELPKGALRGLIVFRLYLDDVMLERVDPEVFQGVYRLRMFHVRQSSLKEIPHFQGIRDSLRTLNFHSSLLTSLSGNGLKNLPNLESISFVNNSISSIDPDVFQGTDNVLIFDLSYNKLTSLPPHLLDRWSRLRKVVLSHNQLLHVDGLFAIAHPKFILLDWNNLTDLDSILHPNMKNVETVQLSFNPISRVSSHSFNGKVPNMRFLYMDHCLVTNFSAKHFSQLSILATLDLSYNLVEEVSNQTIGFGYSIELHFVANKITHFSAELPHNVKRVYLSGNFLTSLGETLRFSQMSEVSMADNQITTLDPEDFRGVHGVLVLALQGNRISSVHRRTFLTVRKDLQFLDLSRNLLRSINGSVRSLSLLTALNLTNNKLQKLEEGEFSGLNELTELYLHGNQLHTIGNEMHQLPQLQYLVVSYNKIRTITTEQIPKTLQFLYLKGNPFRCDCSLFPFLQHLNTSERLKTDVPLCITPLLPNPPPCPEPCTCTCDTTELVMTVDCSNTGLQALPEMFRRGNHTGGGKIPISFYNSVLQTSGPWSGFQGPPRAWVSTSQPPFYLFDDVGVLDLSNNSLGPAFGADAYFPHELRRLRIDHNGLTEPPPLGLIPEGLAEVSVAGNPWRCDCDTVPFKNWIVSKSDTLLSGNETRCGPPSSEGPRLTDRVIGSLTDIDLCPSNIGLYVSLSFAVLLFFLAITSLKIMYTRYETHVKVWLYSHGITWVKERDIDKDKPFDAFISFSHKDANFVSSNIINVIESKAPNVRLCLHYRDFVAGFPIHTNILEAIKLCKRTVLILSRNFVESEWCMMEFHEAHRQAVRDAINRVIVVRVGELPEVIHPTLRVYLESTTYLTWGEKYFWQNLFYALPTSSQKHGGGGRTCEVVRAIKL